MDLLSTLVAQAHHLGVPTFLLAQMVAMGASAGLVAWRWPRSSPSRGVALAVPLGAAVGALVLGLLLRLPAIAAGRASEGRSGLLMAFGALAGAAAGALLAGRRAGIGDERALDAVAPSLGVMVVFGRLGCLLAGCCFGPPGGAGVVYPAGTPCWSEHVRRGWIALDAPASLPVVPTPLGEIALGAAMIALGLGLGTDRRGAAFAVVMAVYAAGRFALEVLRDDAPSAGGGLGVTRWLAIAALAALAAASVRERRVAG